MKATQHIPNFCDFRPEDGDTRRMVEFETTEQLISEGWVKAWEDDFSGHKFSHWAKSGRHLMAVYGNKPDAWWVVAYLSAPEMVQLPEMAYP